MNATNRQLTNPTGSRNAVVPAFGRAWSLGLGNCHAWCRRAEVLGHEGATWLNRGRRFARKAFRAGSRVAGSLVLGLLLCAASWASDEARLGEHVGDYVRTVVLENALVTKWLTSEFGGSALRGAAKIEGVAYEIREESYVRVVGRMDVEFTNEASALGLYRTASKRGHFRTRKILTTYSVRREGKVVSIYYREGVEIESGSDKCDCKCRFDAVDQLRSQAPAREDPAK